MHSILLPFRYIFGYAAIIGIMIPVIGSILARRNGVKFSFEMRLFEIYCYVAAFIQLLAVILSFAKIDYLIIFDLSIYVQFLIFVFILLKWMNFKRLYKPLIAIIFLIIFTEEFFLNLDFREFLFRFFILTLSVLTFLLSYKVDKEKINLPKEYSYIHIGAYLYSLITIIGFSTFGSELSSFGHLIQVFASLTAIYYYYRSFRCLYP